MIVQERILTAGAYVWVQGRFPFVVGPTPSGDRLGIARLGGHREDGETPWDCAARELVEEAALAITPLPTPATYWVPGEPGRPILQEIPWRRSPENPPAPLLVIPRRQSAELTVMYLARAETPPHPAGEVNGLLLLRPAEVVRLCRERMSLARFRAAGGQALLSQAMDEELLLEPFLQCRLLATLLDRHPHLVG